MNFVIPRDTLPHDWHQVVICIPTVDHQRLLHGYSQTQLTLKNLHRGAEKQNTDHDIYYYFTMSSFHSTQYISHHRTMIKAYPMNGLQSLIKLRTYQTTTYLFLPGGVSGIFVGVVEAHLTKCHSFWMTHGHQYVAFMDT